MVGSEHTMHPPHAVIEQRATSAGGVVLADRRMSSVRTIAPSPPPDSLCDSFVPWQPLTRRDQLVMTHDGDEVLGCDTAKHHIHHLNPTSHAIWSLCDGTRTVPGIAQAVGVVDLALGQLGEAHLLAGPLPTAGRARDHGS